MAVQSKPNHLYEGCSINNETVLITFVQPLPNHSSTVLVGVLDLRYNYFRRKFPAIEETIAQKTPHTSIMNHEANRRQPHRGTNGASYILMLVLESSLSQSFN